MLLVEIEHLNPGNSHAVALISGYYKTEQQARK